MSRTNTWLMDSELKEDRLGLGVMGSASSWYAPGIARDTAGTVKYCCERNLFNILLVQLIVESCKLIINCDCDRLANLILYM